ncbi:interleukin-1 receptor accessory protein, partial [Arapaima gigas]
RMSFHSALLCLLLAVLLQDGASEVLPGHPSPYCQDMGSFGGGTVKVYGGEASVLHCPLYQSGYTSLNLDWYWAQSDEMLENSIPVGHVDSRISKEGERLWFHPTALGDTGLYICVLSNRTHCAKTAIALEVLQRPEGQCVSQAPWHPVQVEIPVEEGKTLNCPDIQDFKHRDNLSVQWFHNCNTYKWGSDREQKGQSLVIHLMRELYAGNYTCLVTYTFRGEKMNFTRVVALKPVSSSRIPKDPVIHTPSEQQIFTVKIGSEVNLKCQIFLPHLDGKQPLPEVWWEVDKQLVGQFGDPRFSNTTKVIQEHLGDRTVEIVLHIQGFRSKDLQKEYTCFAKNSRNQVSRKVVVQAEEYLPHLELGFGLAVPVVVILFLFVVYHIFRLELLLLYRSRCVCQTFDPDGKEFDIYISYARNSAEEQFVHMTLQRVLENELGYKVCIFDRDSLPGGTITDETLRFVGRSRRLIVVLSPAYVLQGTQALLELKAGLDSMALGGDLRVILVQYQPISRSDWVRELRRARIALTLIRWKGEKSAELSSRFWKQLQVELPIQWKKDKPSSSVAHSACKQYALIPFKSKIGDPVHNTHKT